MLAKSSDTTSATDFAGKESEPDDGEDEDIPARLAAMSEVDLRELRRKLAGERDAMRASLDALPRDAKGAVHPRHVATARLLVDMVGPRMRRGLLHKLRELFLPKHRGDTANAVPASIPIDGPADIETKRLSAPMFEGEIFGEMSCFNRVPRSATIIVEQECYVLEMTRNVLDSLHGDESYKKKMDEVYRRRVLEAHLRRLPLFQQLSEERLDWLKRSVELVEFKTGSTIFEEGQPSDCFYVIRSGLVKVVVSAGAMSRRTLAYLGRGDFIGEMGVMLGQPRNATCTAIDHPDSGQDIPSDKRGAVGSRVELVRIDARTFHELVASSPQLQKDVEAVIAARQAHTAVTLQQSVGELARSASTTRGFDELGLIQGQRLMLIDLDRCTRCGACVDACISAHDDRRSRLYLDGPRFEKYLVPITCRSCLDPVCMIGCPVGAINRGDNGEIRIENWCIGCELCAKQCPYGSIHMSELSGPFDKSQLCSEQVAAMEAGTSLKAVTKQATVCDLCSSLRSGDPACVYACPHDAALRVHAQEYFVDTERDHVGLTCN